MSECGGNPEKCKTCGKKGVSIFLVRPAVATRDTSEWYTDPKDLKKTAAAMQASGAPEISGAFVKPSVGLGETAYYTLRQLRGGYVYVYDEARKTWKGYYVSDMGYYTEFDIEATFGQAAIKGEKPEEKAPCKPDQFGLLAKSVTIDKAEEATNLWFVFTDATWTEATWKTFDENKDGIREKQMSKFDVKQWLSSQSHPQACKFEEASQHVAEFSDTVKRSTFDFSPTLFVREGYYNFEKYSEKMMQYKKEDSWVARWMMGDKDYSKNIYQAVELEKLMPNLLAVNKRYEGSVADSTYVNHDVARLYNMAVCVARKEGTSAEMALDKMLSDCYVNPVKAGVNGWGGKSQEEINKIAVFAVDDIPGTVMDLASLMSMRATEFSAQPQYERKLFASGSIVNYQNAVYSRAELEELERQRKAYLDELRARHAASEISTITGKPTPNPTPRLLTPIEKEHYDAIVPTEEELDKARQRAWLLYSKKLKDYDPPKGMQSLPSGRMETFEEFTARK
ncbi:MAG: hypothetical protein FWD67_12785, partial [Betaproteobacteria bacterium]|nr:hypothetical protein [Betaproteobacteria bacterium]